MAENSNIEWTDHTFNPWIGCTKVSPACDNCYAERDMDHRFGRVKWGAGQPRSRTSVQNWNKPLAWDRKAAKICTRPKVFCASLADVFDTEVDDQWRDDLFKLIGQTPNLDWLLLTKRPGAAAAYRPRWQNHNNIWLGTTVENQDVADARIHYLLKAPWASKRFLSMEPLLSDVNLEQWLWGRFQMECDECAWVIDDGSVCDCAVSPRLENDVPAINWVIVGGESGPDYRVMHRQWAADLKDQCASAGVAYFLKQMSGNTPADRKAIPPELMLREMPS